MSASERGQLFLPEFTATADPALQKTLEDLVDVPCLVLLGEPGMGKTFTIREHAETLRQRLSSDSVLRIDLEPLSTDAGLLNAIFGHNTYLTWKQGAHKLFLFLDSLDKSQIGVSAAAELLAQNLQGAPVERLYMRVACRAIDWPLYLEQELHTRWPKVGDESRVQKYHLRPLGPQDIITAAIQNEIDPQELVEAVIQSGVLPLARLPITLQFLIEEFQDTGEVLGKRTDLYHNGCLRLCDQEDDSITKSKKRLAMASRIAAITIFSQRYAITTDISSRDASDVLLSDLFMGDQSEEEKMIQDTLSTGLFVSAGSQRWVWSHQSFAEYLAALYLTTYSVPAKQVLGLCTAPEGAFAPQLSETIIWLSDLRADMFERVVRKDPTILSRMNWREATPDDFREFINRLLALDDEHIYLRLSDALRDSRFDLYHPNIAKIIRPFIADRTKSDYLRRFVLDLVDHYALNAGQLGTGEVDISAEALSDNEVSSGVTDPTPLDLNEVLLQVVFDLEDNYVVRRLAIHAIYDHSDRETKRKLKPLIGGTFEDPDDELKGYALLSLWPDDLTAGELFQVLIPPKRRNYFGGYKSFLASESFVRELNLADLPVALEWVSRQPRAHDQDFSLQDIVNKIMQKAWDNIDHPGAFESFVIAALSRLLAMDPIVGERHNSDQSAIREDLLADTSKRRRLVEALATLAMERDIEPRYVRSFREPLLLAEDLDWLIERMNARDSEEWQRFWAEFVRYSFDPGNRDIIDRIYYAGENNPILWEKVKHFFEPWLLDDPEKKDEKRRHYEHKLQEEEFAQRQKHERPPTELVDEWLDSIEGGKVSGWIPLVGSLLLEPSGGRHYYTFDQPDLTVFPGWRATTEHTRMRIINAAKTYVAQAQPSSEEWIGTKSIPYADLTGYLALFLITQQDFAFLQSLPSKVWKRWTQILTWWSIHLTEHQDDQNRLLQLAYQSMPDDLISVLLKRIDFENQGDGISVLRKFEPFWDNRLAKAILDKVKDPDLKPIPMQLLLEPLLEHNIPEAEEFARLVVLHGYVTLDERDRVVNAAVVLLEYADNAGWDIIWPIIQRDNDLGRTVVENVANREFRSGNVGQTLRDDPLADFLIWLEHQYPHADDPQIDGWHTVSSHEKIRRWWDGMLRQLYNRGTPDSAKAVQRLADTFPEITGLQVMRLEARAMTDRATWQPALPKDVLQLSFPQKPKAKWYSRKKFAGAIGRFVVAIIVAIIAGLAILILEQPVKELFNISDQPASTITPAPESTSTPSDVVAEPTEEITPEATLDSVNTPRS